MHEAGLMRALMRRVDEVAAAEGAGRVVAVRVRIGALAHMSPEHFLEHWAVAAAGTIAEHARLDIETSDDLTDPAAQDVTLLSLEVQDAAP